MSQDIVKKDLSEEIGSHHSRCRELKGGQISYGLSCSLGLRSSEFGTE
jgi:hypothetical protein